VSNSHDERLRNAYKLSLEDRAKSRVMHAAPEALLALAERSGNEAVRLETLDHVMSCDVCRRDLDLIRASVIAAGVPRQRTWFRSPAMGLIALAATLLIVAGVRLFMSSADSEAGPRLRGGAGVATYGVRWLPAVGAGLAWKPTVGAESYRVEVVDEGGVAVVDTNVRDTVFVVADSLLRSRRGVTWSVTATLGDGSTVTSLPSPLVSPSR
jgi:hypothetical protein